MTEPLHVTSVGATAPANPTTSFTITIPANVSTGHLMFALATSRNHSTATALLNIVDNDAGGNTWTLASTSADRKVYMWHKYATSATAGKTITVSTGVNSLTGGLSVYSDTHTSIPYTNLSLESNASGDETHAGFLPDNASSMICLSVHNWGNDNSISATSTETNPVLLALRFNRLSTGGSDCATALASNPQTTAVASTGGFGWAQTNGVTYSFVWAIPPGAPAPAAEQGFVRFVNYLTGMGSGLVAPGQRIAFYSFDHGAA